ncbi:MAG: hypothetical protein ABI438_02530 [Dermatophilaceae bacterium]
MSIGRVQAALSVVLDARVAVTPAAASVKSTGTDVSLVTLAERTVSIAWLPVGWPKQVREILARAVVPDLVAAPEMSAGARRTAADAGLGWFDETGAADFTLGPTILVRRDGTPRLRLNTNLGWRPATTAVCEALLTGSAATVGAVQKKTGLAMSTVATALKFLEAQKLLYSGADRGPRSARTITDQAALLEAYAAAAARLRSPQSIRVGTLWRDPIAGVIETGRLWTAAGVRWSTTSALTADVLAPLLTQVSPMEIYVEARTLAQLRDATLKVNLAEASGGRLLLRPFPSPAGAALSSEIRPGFWAVPWPRAFADLRDGGVRGEEAADHLREVCESD